MDTGTVAAPPLSERSQRIGRGWAHRRPIGSQRGGVAVTIHPAVPRELLATFIHTLLGDEAITGNMADGGPKATRRARPRG